MRRRDFIKVAGGFALTSSQARAQDRVRRVGELIHFAADNPNSKGRIANFKQGLQQLGWIEGRNIELDIRYGDSKPDLYPVRAKELVAAKPEVIVAHTTPMVAALRRETRTIPIVFISVSDPIGSGFVTSLARPGGNSTGLMAYEPGIVGKWLAMLKEIAPQMTRAALIANPRTLPFDYFVRSAKSTAPSLGIDAVPSPVASAADIEHAIGTFAKVPNGGLVILPSATLSANRDLVVRLAAQHRLPAVYAQDNYVTAGGLMSYSTDLSDQSRQAAYYVDRILRGAKPGDLPVQAPTKYETRLNLKTAKALGFSVPPSLLVRADKVIE
jgi:putative ABC transport system substrate-binding protein